MTSIYFNPRTPVGCDIKWEFDAGGRIISIHAPQWGATGEAAAKSPSSAYFNPRTPVGCDRCIEHGQLHRGHFNPRTPVGCDVIV